MKKPAKAIKITIQMAKKKKEITVTKKEMRKPVSRDREVCSKKRS